MALGASNWRFLLLNFLTWSCWCLRGESFLLLIFLNLSPGEPELILLIRKPPESSVNSGFEQGFMTTLVPVLLIGAFSLKMLPAFWGRVTTAPLLLLISRTATETWQQLWEDEQEDEIELSGVESSWLLEEGGSSSSLVIRLWLQLSSLMQTEPYL